MMSFSIRQFKVPDSFVERLEALIPSQFKNGEDISYAYFLLKLFLVIWNLFLATAGYDVWFLKHLESRTHHMQCKCSHGNIRISHRKVWLCKQTGHVPHAKAANSIDPDYLHWLWLPTVWLPLHWSIVILPEKWARSAMLSPKLHIL